MSLQRLHPRIPSAEQVPVFPNGRNPRMLGWVVIGVALLPAALAVFDDRLGFRFVMAALAVTVVSAGVALLVMFGVIEPRVVRVDTDARSLRFVPPAAAVWPISAIAVALLLPAVAQLVVDTQGLPTMAGGVLLTRAPYLLGVLGLAILTVQLWRRRIPAGLELTPERLRGIRGHLDLGWDELAQVSVVAGRAAKLSLVPRGGKGRPVLAPTLALGSDPNQVAAIVRYYLERPAERAALAEGGVAAVRRVEAASVAG
ncbi:hypothetical protein [Microbacterium sp. GXF7504]